MSILNQGVQCQLIAESPSGAGVTNRAIAVQTDSILVTLWVASITGTLTVTAYAVAGPGQETVLFQFPVVSTGTTDLLLRRASISTSNVRIAAVYTGACSYEVHARAINGGITTARIVGAENFRTSQKTVGTTPVLLIPAGLSDRNGMVLKHWAGASTVYIGESASAANSASGYPLAPQDALALDVVAGVEVYGITTTGTVDIRIAESGA